jgi:hypothetical protein
MLYTYEFEGISKLKIPITHFNADFIRRIVLVILIAYQIVISGLVHINHSQYDCILLRLILGCQDVLTRKDSL